MQVVDAIMKRRSVRNMIERMHRWSEHWLLRLCWLFRVMPSWRAPEPTPRKDEPSYQIIRSRRVFRFSDRLREDELPACCRKSELTIKVAVAVWSREDGTIGALRLDYPEYELLTHGPEEH